MEQTQTLSQRALETRGLVIARVHQARILVGEITAMVGSAMSDLRLSDQGRRERVERILASPEGRPGVAQEIAAARRHIEVTFELAGQELEELTAVTPDQMAARAAVLSPVLSSAMERPEGLINAYRRRYENLVDRRLLEESASAVIDALGDNAGPFSEQWHNEQATLQLQRPPEERQALTDRAELEEQAAYLANVERVIQADLDALASSAGIGADFGSEEASNTMIARELALAEVNRYESRLGVGATNMGAGDSW